MSRRLVRCPQPGPPGRGPQGEEVLDDEENATTSVLVTTSKALVTRSDALVASSF